ncbi:MAG TPA: cytochrome c maturation protein CcmE [Solirubrobacterales bacterium]|jgi:cytochrome c-type biogenesis protein CcmE|nr:cytochrome c maturation protein CcmE [Solirubrobacterales bacterium]
MDPDRKRKIRLGVALGTAVLLAAALVYTSFSASTEAKQPSDLLSASADGTYDLTGKVVADSVRRTDDGLRFEIEDRDGSASLPVAYTGAVPDPFREGREVIVTGEMQDGTFVAERDSLVTKCPSKFSDEAEQDPEHVIIDE